MIHGNVFMRFTSRDRHRECVCVCFWSPNVQFVRIKLFCKCVSETIVSKIAWLQYHITVYLQVKHINTFCLIALLSGVMDFLFSI